MTALDMANWWGECFELADQKAAFIDAVGRRIARALEHGERLMLYVDYDPNEPLLEVLREIGVECSGFLSSAEGIFSGGKFGMAISADGGVQVKDGYGQDTVFCCGLPAMTSVELKDALEALIEEHGLNSNGVVVTTCLLDDGRLLLEVEGEADGQKLANGQLFPPTDICRHCAIVTMMGLIDSVREAMCSTKTAPN